MKKIVFIILDKFANWELAYLSANEAVSDHKVVTAFLYPTHRRLSQSNTNELIDKSTFRIELAFSNKNSPCGIRTSRGVLLFVVLRLNCY